LRGYHKPSIGVSSQPAIIRSKSSHPIPAFSQTNKGALSVQHSSPLRESKKDDGGGTGEESTLHPAGAMAPPPLPAYHRSQEKKRPAPPVGVPLFERVPSGDDTNPSSPSPSATSTAQEQQVPQSSSTDKMNGTEGTESKAILHEVLRLLREQQPSQRQRPGSSRSHAQQENSMASMTWAAPRLLTPPQNAYLTLTHS